MERADQLLTDLQDCEAASLVGAHDAGVEIAERALQTARESGLRSEAALAAAWLAEHQLRRGESKRLHKAPTQPWRRPTRSNCMGSVSSCATP